MLRGAFIENKAIEYIPSNSKYQKLAILRPIATDANDRDYITANLVGNGEVEVTKVSENGSVLKGAGFKLVKDGKDATSVKETGSNGKVVFSDLAPGTYEVVETKAPTGHVLNGTKQTVTVTAGNTSKVKVSNDIIKGRVKVLKTYEVVETKAPTGHVLNGTKQTVTVTAGNTSKVKVSNDIIKGRVKVLKIDEETKEPLQGAEFELREKATGKVVEKLVTGEDGRATSGLHPFGEYILQETKAPNKYTLNNKEYLVTISEHMQTIEVTAKNRIIKGQIAVSKSDSEIDSLNLEGVEFEISNEEGAVVDTLVTNENGYAISKVLNHGKYFLKETKTLPTHILNKKVYEVNITEDGKVYTYDIKNDVIKGKIQIVKVDKENEEVPVEGAIFDVIADDVFGVKTGTKVDTITSDKDGFAYTKDLRAGRYKIVETFAPEGYWQSDKEYFVDVTEHGKVYVRYISNEPIQAKLRVLKTDGKEKYPLADAKFKIVNKKTGKDVEFKEFIGIIPIKKTVFTTDEKGEFVTPQHLKYGEYQLVEVEAPEGYNLAEPIEFSINEDTPMEDIELLGTITTQEVINTRITGNMELLKIDEETQEPLENVEFQVTCTDGFMKDNTWSLKSDVDGKVSLNGLEHGKYKVEEVKTIEGYVLNSEPIEFEIKEHGKTVKLEMTNRKIKGFVEIHKTDSETNRALKDVEFTIWNMNKAEVDKLVTDEKGYAKSKALDYGRYVMKETKADENYITSDKFYEIEITEDGKVYTYDITNDVKKGDLEFSKTDVTTGEIVEGAKIEISGVSETNNHIKFDFISSKDDKFKLPVGKYEFEEVIAPDGYVINKEVGTFEIKENGEVVKAELKNKKIEGTLLFEKTDVSTGDVIDGAHIKIECIEGFDQGKVIEFVSSKDGNKFPLLYGKYKITETMAPNGYIKTDEVGEFEITEDGQIVKAVSSKDGNKFPLLYGKYKITETMAPNGYIKTDEVGEFEITEDGQIVKAQLKNQRMVIVDNPKTGDVGIIGVSVLAVSALGGLLYVNTKNKKDEE